MLAKKENQEEEKMKLVKLEVEPQPGFPGKAGDVYVNPVSVNWLQDLGDGTTNISVGMAVFQVGYSVEELRKMLKI